MKSQLIAGRLCVKKSPIHGYGVFADQMFAVGDIIEECHTLYTSWFYVDFKDYFFCAGEKYALPLGYGVIYNHDADYNADHEWDKEEKVFRFVAIKPILKGQEILISYGSGYFSSRGVKPKNLSFKGKCFRYLRAWGFIFRFAFILACLWGGLQLLTLLKP